MELNHFAAIHEAIVQMLTSHGDVFLTTGLRMFQAFAAIMLAWFGVRTALASASGRAFDFSRFASLVLMIAIGQAMIGFYDRPLPGLGLSFVDLVLDQALFLANRLETESIAEVQLRLHELFNAVERPGLLDGLQILHYVIATVVIAVAEALVLAVTAYGFVAVGVCVLIGPIFIPFFIVPSLDWLFWGWLRAFIQYAFYQVIAYAFITVFSSFLVGFLDAHPPPYTAPSFAFLIFPLLFVLIAFIFGILRIPSLVSNIFAGRAGDSALPRHLR